MKKIIVLTSLIFCATFATFAQRFAYVNTEYILGNIPEYNDAQKQIDKLVQDWKAEAEKRQKEIDDAYKSYQNEQYLLTEDQKKTKMQAIEQKEKDLKQFQQDKFGYQGELFQKRQELIKPIQDKVYDAIQKMATERNYDFVFDKASSTAILYADIKNDKSDDILKAMGYTPQQKTTKTGNN